MKRILLISLMLAALLITSCAARNERLIAGVWSGSGELVLEELPLDGADLLIFNTDHSGYIAEGLHSRSFSWSVTDETLTLRFPDIAVGLAFRVDSDTLTIRHTAGNAEFTRMAD